MTNSLNQETYKKIASKDSFYVCCFFTENYRVHAMSLKKSLDNFNLSYYIELSEEAGYWEANTRIKPHFLKNCLERFKDKNILYLDADSVVKKPLDYFDNIEQDICVYETHDQPSMSHNYLTGTIFLKNNLSTTKFVQTWINEQKSSSKIQVDQDSFQQAIEKTKDTIQIKPLPAGYIKIFDNNYEGDIYIEHYQASRSQTKLKRQKIRQRNRIAGITILVIIAAIAYGLWRF